MGHRQAAGCNVAAVPVGVLILQLWAVTLSLSPRSLDPKSFPPRWSPELLILLLPDASHFTADALAGPECLLTTCLSR